MGIGRQFCKDGIPSLCISELNYTSIIIVTLKKIVLKCLQWINYSRIGQKKKIYKEV